MQRHVHKLGKVSDPPIHFEPTPIRGLLVCTARVDQGWERALGVVGVDRTAGTENAVRAVRGQVPTPGYPPL